MLAFKIYQANLITLIEIHCEELGDLNQTLNTQGYLSFGNSLENSIYHRLSHGFCQYLRQSWSYTNRFESLCLRPRSGQNGQLPE